jgi:hypothetical protein
VKVKLCTIFSLLLVSVQSYAAVNYCEGQQKKAKDQRICLLYNHLKKQYFKSSTEFGRFNDRTTVKNTESKEQNLVLKENYTLSKRLVSCLDEAKTRYDKYALEAATAVKELDKILDQLDRVLAPGFSFVRSTFILPGDWEENEEGSLFSFAEETFLTSTFGDGSQVTINHDLMNDDAIIYSGIYSSLNSVFNHDNIYSNDGVKDFRHLWEKASQCENKISLKNLEVKVEKFLSGMIAEKKEKQTIIKEVAKRAQPMINNIYDPIQFTYGSHKKNFMAAIYADIIIGKKLIRLSKQQNDLKEIMSENQISADDLIESKAKEGHTLSAIFNFDYSKLDLSEASLAKNDKIIKAFQKSIE